MHKTLHKSAKETQVWIIIWYISTTEDTKMDYQLQSHCLFPWTVINSEICVYGMHYLKCQCKLQFQLIMIKSGIILINNLSWIMICFISTKTWEHGSNRKHFDFVARPLYHVFSVVSVSDILPPHCRRYSYWVCFWTIHNN